MTHFPPFDCLQAMRLVQDMQMALAGNESAAAFSIKNAIGKVPDKLIIETVQDMAADNYNAMANMLGAELTGRVMSFGGRAQVFHPSKTVL